MACVFGEMGTLKTSERWGGCAPNLSRLGRPVNWFPEIAARRRNVSSVLAPLLVSARLNHCIAFSPSHVISLVHLLIRPD